MIDRVKLNKPSRIRSPSYPCIDFKSAIDRARQLYKFAKKSEVRVTVILTHWGFSSTSANGMKVISALKSFGLIEDSGKRDSRSIKLTNDGYRILHDHEGSHERVTVIKKCALSPPIYSYCWSLWGDDMPSDEVMKSHLILERKFNAGAVRGFLKDYKATISYAELTKSDNITDDSHDTDGGGEVEDSSDNPPGDEFPGREGIKPSPLKPNMKQDIFTLEEGQVVIQWPADLTEASFEDLTDWLELLHRKIARTVEGQNKPKLQRANDK